MMQFYLQKLNFEGVEIKNSSGSHILGPQILEIVI